MELVVILITVPNLFTPSIKGVGIQFGLNIGTGDKSYLKDEYLGLGVSFCGHT
jgi:hypothetical protein